MQPWTRQVDNQHAPPIGPNCSATNLQKCRRASEQFARSLAECVKQDSRNECDNWWRVAACGKHTSDVSSWTAVMTQMGH